ncbi:hypothetical protein [Nitrosopumilus cobalaminigenes]|uniref:hypothetical protein n=1 Tax=Nitrosopumilus cobalaminigenes TaxID=1470066 RepID=UPI0015C7B122|nr:hypothetical protein [Nitrosopumilus cobalaminigenes]
MEIKQVGEILTATNVITHYTKKIARVKLLTANAMRLMNRLGIRKNLPSLDVIV